MILRPGDPAPDFELPQLVSAASTAAPLIRKGQAPQQWRLAHALSRGPALLVFAKESCPTCQFALPLIDRIHRNYAHSKVSLVTIAQEDSAEAGRMVEDLSLQMPVLLDEDPYPVSELYGIAYVPTLFYARPDGEIDQVMEGFAREELREINERIAGLGGCSPIPFYRAEEGVPPFRPG